MQYMGIKTYGESAKVVRECVNPSFYIAGTKNENNDMLKEKLLSFETIHQQSCIKSKTDNVPVVSNVEMYSEHAHN